MPHGNDASAATVPESWTGNLNHLDESQTASFDKFKKVLAEQELYVPPRNGAAASHDESTLLRFLRARKFDVNGGLAQFKATEEWRKTNHIDALYENIDVESYEDSRRVYPQWTGRRDRRGIPIYVFQIGHLNNKNMSAYLNKANSTVASYTHAESSVPARLLRLFALYENMTKFVTPLCSDLPRPNTEVPIVCTTNIVDVSGTGLMQFWNLKSHMQDASVLASAHYPETLDRIFIIGAPSFFPTVWSWIKRWFDPGTTSKIFILSASEVKPTLTKFMEPANIPKQYGGELDWEWCDMPNLDEPARKLIGSLDRIRPMGDGDVNTPPIKNGFCKGPMLWRGDRVDIMGSHAGQPRRRTLIAQAHAAFKTAMSATPNESRGTVQNALSQKGQERAETHAVGEEVSA